MYICIVSSSNPTEEGLVIHGASGGDLLCLRPRADPALRPKRESSPQEVRNDCAVALGALRDSCLCRKATGCGRLVVAPVGRRSRSPNRKAHPLERAGLFMWGAWR